MKTEIEKILNIESPFTELFSQLKLYENLAPTLPMTAYGSGQLNSMNAHIDNAINVLLQGLQDLGQLIGLASRPKREKIEELNRIGFFISAISNLTVALNDLKADADHVLKERGDVNQ